MNVRSLRVPSLILAALLVLSACGGAAPSAPTAAAVATAVAPAVNAIAPTVAAAATAVAPTVNAVAPTIAAAATIVSKATGPKDKVTLQSKWVAQAQFAGYYAAKEKGFYDAENLDVTIRPGGPDIVPEQVVAGKSAEFGIDWLPSLMVAREQGAPLVNIAQVFNRSGMRELAWKDSNITQPADLKGKKVGVWLGGNEFELFAALNKSSLNPEKDVNIIAQPFDMNLFLGRQVDAAAAMTYNEYYQVLSAGHKPEEINVMDFNQIGTAMLEDSIFTREDYLADPKNKDIAVRFVHASLKGWEYCRDNVDDCVNTVLKNDASGAMKKDAQKWQMDEINKLMFPLPDSIKDKGLGDMDPAAFKQTADIALQFKVIKNPASDKSYTSEIWSAATGKK